MKTKFLNNIELKILSLIIALVLWIIVRGEQRTDIYLSVKVEAKNLPSYLVITSQSSDRVNVRLKGSKSLLAKIDRKYFKPYVCDLAGASFGERECKIIPSSFNIENGIRIIDVSPKMIVFDLDTLTKKDVQVGPDFLGSLDKGYEVEEFKVYPEKITVVGPKQYLEELTVIKTAPIDLKERKRSFVVKLPVAVSSSSLSVDGNIDEVLVNVRIRERHVVRVIKDIPIRMNSKNSSWALHDGYVNVKIIGPAGKANDIKREEVEIVAASRGGFPPDAKKGDRIEANLSIVEIPGLTLSSDDSVYFVKKE